MKWDKFGFGRATLLERMEVWLEDHPVIGMLLTVLIIVVIPMTVILLTQ